VSETDPQQPHHRPARHALPLVLASIVIATVLAAAFGEGAPLGARLAALSAAMLGAGWTPAAYLLGAIGWGYLVRRWATHPAVAAALGLAATLTITHGFGVLGMLNPITAWIWTGAGLFQLVFWLRTARPTLLAPLRDRVCLIAACCGAIGAAIAFVAAASPPGALWNSEFGGYDALSYHLQLPAEWLDAGRITPVQHNVYSYLPGYIEAAAVHLAHLANAPARTPDGLSGLLTGAGDLAIAPHFLSFGLLLLAAWWTGSFASIAAARSGLDDAARTRSAFIAGALVLVTPWSQVVGSLAYNETGVVALGAAALLAAWSPQIAPAKRGVLVAVLIGAACGCKPTAILFLAPAAAIAMAWNTPKHHWPAMFALGAIAGLLMLAPWLARNAAHGGNPVYPALTGVFGTAHWSVDQADAYARGHRFDGSLLDRALMLVRPDPAAGPNAPAVARFRGLTNPQWALTPWLGLIGVGVMLAKRPSHIAGFVLASSLAAALLAWMLATHLQSRFLIPLTPLLAAGAAAGLASLQRANIAPIAAALLGASALWSVVNFSDQRSGSPNALLAYGPHLFTDRLEIEGIGEVFPTAWINRNTEGGLLLIGDATPFYHKRPVDYATVWDTHPLAAAMREHPADPDAWTRSLREAGLQWALVSFSELDRLTRSGWADPMLTPERVGAWARTLGEPTHVWPDQGRALYRLPEVAP
jgi:hypothetical protein